MRHRLGTVIVGLLLVGGVAGASLPPHLGAARAASAPHVAAGTEASYGARLAADGGWTPVNSGVQTTLYAISCPAEGTCYAVDARGVALKTTDGGASWAARQTSSTYALFGIACPTAQACHAAGSISGVVGTGDGGGSWRTESPSASLNGIACPGATTCYAVGPSGILATTNGGGTWAAQSNPAAGGGYPLVSVSCGSASACVAVGGNGVIVATTDGGHTWTSRLSNTTVNLSGVSCPSPSACVAVGQQGTLLSTTDGGASWTTAHNPVADIDPVLVTEIAFWGVTCTGTTVCYAVGAGAAIARTSDSGHTWGLVKKPVYGATELHGVSCAGAACYVVGLNGTILVNRSAAGGSVVTPPTCTPTRPIVSSSPGGTLYFERGAYIYAANAAGGNVRQVTSTGSAREPDADPAVSPDGRTLAYSRPNGAHAGIQLIPTSGGAPSLFSGTDDPLASGAAWSHDGRRVAYNFTFRNGYGSATVASVEVREASSGKAVKLISNIYNPYADPTFSGDGCRLIVSQYYLGSTNAATRHIGLTSIDVITGKKVRVIAGDAAYDDHYPVVSPDGALVAYVRTPARQQSGGSLWVMNADGSGAHQLAQAADARRPAWSPDGSALAFANGHAVYTVPAGGGAPVLRIPNATDPAWGSGGATTLSAQTALVIDSMTMYQPVNGKDRPTRTAHLGRPTDIFLYYQSAAVGSSSSGRLRLLSRGKTFLSAAMYPGTTTAGSTYYGIRVNFGTGPRALALLGPMTAEATIRSGSARATRSLSFTLAR